jgi:hypothetical protein
MFLFCCSCLYCRCVSCSSVLYCCYVYCVLLECVLNSCNMLFVFSVLLLYYCHRAKTQLQFYIYTYSYIFHYDALGELALACDVQVRCNHRNRAVAETGIFVFSFEMP